MNHRASVSVVVWTGALIAFQLRGTSSQLSGAFSLLEYAFIAPLVALLFQGVLLRTIAFVGALAFAAMAIRQILFYLLFAWLLRRFASDDPDREFFATDLGHRLLKSTATVTIFPVGYAGAVAAATLAIAIADTEYAVALASVGALCFGLYYILNALKNDKAPLTPAQRTANTKAFGEMLAIFQRRADRLRGVSPSSAEGATPTQKQEVAEGAKVNTNAPTDADRANRLALASELREVARFLAQIRNEQPRPGLLSSDQVQKTRNVLRRAMERAADDKEAFDVAMGLNALLASLDPEGSDTP